MKKLVADNFHPSAADYTTKAQITRTYDDFLAYGNYFTQLQPFLKEFSLENFHFMDGTRMASTDALDEAQQFEKFLGLENDLDFERNEEKGFMCLSKPVEFCLSGAKGRKSTLDYKVDKLFWSIGLKILQKILEPEIKLLRDYFKPEMTKLFSLILPNETTNTFCSSPDNRFAWLKLYVC